MVVILQKEAPILAREGDARIRTVVEEELGLADGCTVGVVVGAALGWTEGVLEGADVGPVEGCVVGT